MVTTGVEPVSQPFQGYAKTVSAKLPQYYNIYKNSCQVKNK